MSSSNSAMSNAPSTKLYAAANDGFAHDNGLIFSSLNSQTVNTITNPIIVVPSESQMLKPIDTSMQSSNVNNFIDYGSNYVPLSPSFSQISEKPSKPHQQTDSSTAFTFAPLLAVPSLPVLQQTNYSSHDLISNINLPSRPANPVPIQKPKNRCGITKFTDSRVVGGSITQSGKKKSKNITKIIHLIFRS